MGVVTQEPRGAERLPCVGGLVRLAGPPQITSVLVELLSQLRIPSDSHPGIDVVLSPDGRMADGVVDGRLVWSIALPNRAPAATLLGQVVGSLTTLLTRLLFVHAGAVSFHGRGMVLVGASGCGKTSTVAALLRRGAAYLSDEVALLDPAAGVVMPFVLPLAVKPWTRRAAGGLPQGRTIALEDGVEFWLPQGPPAPPASVETVVLLRPGAFGSRLSPISRASMLLALAEQVSTFKQQHRVGEAFAGFAAILRNARCAVLESPRPARQSDLLVTLRS